MMFRTAAAALLLLATAGEAAAAISKEEKKAGFKPFFNGKDLTEFDGDPRLWKVDNGVIAGSTDGVEIKQNTFLIRKGTYGNFHLKFQVKLRNHNSGVQFRSTPMPEWVVTGLQADMAEGNWWGSLYDEKGKRGVIVNGWKDKAEKVVKPGDWNDYEIKADGDHIQIWVNGLLTADLRDTSKLDGVIALQLHRGPAMKAEFRNLRIKTWK